MEKKSIAKNYVFLAIMLGAMILGAILGWVWPAEADGSGGVVSGTGATVLKPLGTVFINMMFCVVVPMVFASISSAVANMESRKRAGKIMGVTVGTFVVTGAIAAVIMYLLMIVFPPVPAAWTNLAAEEMGEYATLPELIVNFFTASDFSGLLTRQAMLPLIVFSLLFGFAVNLNGGRETPVGKFLDDLANVMLKFVKIITYYAPIAFFGFFADLVATYGPQITENYVRALAVYYPLCFVYIFTAWPLFARFGGGKGAVGVMFRHITKPAVVSLGTCSSVATIPTNMEEAADTGIRKDVADMVLPLGATMHMDGSCFSCVLKIAFVLGVFGQKLDFGMLVPVILVAVLSSVGMSGVPGGGYIGEYIICSIFFPAQMEIAYPILVVIGNLVDPPATMINAAGDYVVCYIVSRFVDGKDWLQKQLKK
ncbi:dicarboxylate/amino acid:cation symporter [uncultured Oscillibacter sp.]|uniref:dicarboxylate/amino acid:cation symporter n=1 Tax=uncultured Oscillibacter sp. TaxID=876091 RepID=UPI0026020A38|nr:dicarboxylate/amino acid:cation symporter [uncultured Oscillibacter sp.]